MGSGRHTQLYNTYFRHQSADYIPGSGFVAVAEGGAASALTAGEELAG